MSHNLGNPTRITKIMQRLTANKTKDERASANDQRETIDQLQAGLCCVKISEQSNIDQNNDSKIVQRASDATELSLSTIFGNQRFSAVSSQHIPTTSLLPSTASIGTSSVIPNAPNIVKQTSNKTPQNSVGIARNILNNQEQKDISGDDVAADELDEQIPVAVPSYQNKSNNFQTPVNSPRIYLKYCGNLLMAPKKQPTRARRCMKKAAESTTEKE
ncbi:unnamed protein product [Onchocerca ochengi]|uniref:Uncharacterized protein n=1 Tax=Onchocerca ochengi TaxID=42157 RepID=A0A182EBE9_ONCOC|nr:unnamed protein product [Onchocerca ochengi]